MVDSIRALGGWPEALPPGQARERLERRAQVLASIREFFAARQVLEVDTPLLGGCPVSDPQLDNLSVADPFRDDQYHYLQTSPEYAMKSLLARGSGSIFQLCKAFRADPQGRFHDMEFTMLEWYRLDFSLDQLIDEIAELLAYVGGPSSVQRLSYREVFLAELSIDPFVATLDELKRCAQRVLDPGFDDDQREVWLDLLLSHCIEPQLGRRDGKAIATFLYDYPAAQAALAQTDSDAHGNAVALRAELYVDGVELANAYKELCDLEQLERRHVEDNRRRQQMAKPQIALDPVLRDAMQRGLPDCAGVALGVDRLLMSLQ